MTRRTEKILTALIICPVLIMDIAILAVGAVIASPIMLVQKYIKEG